MTDNPADRSSLPQRGVGPDVKRVKVVSAPDPSSGYINAIDDFGKTIAVAPLYQVQPQIDEEWIISKALGPWSFAARLSQKDVAPKPTVKPVVRRYNSKYYYDDPTTTDLVNALEALGLITVVRS